MMQHRVRDDHVVRIARQLLTIEVVDRIVDLVDLTRGVTRAADCIFGEVDGIDGRDERPPRDRALQPPFSAAEHEHAQPVADEPAVRPRRQPVARRVARGPLVEVHQHSGVGHPRRMRELPGVKRTIIASPGLGARVSDVPTPMSKGSKS